MPTESKDIKNMQLTVTSSVFDLDTMDEVSLVKTAEFQPATSAKEAMERLNNNPEAFLAAINEGLLTQAKSVLKKDTSNPWNAIDEEGKVIGPFSGTPANSKAVNTLVLTLAKTIFGYAKENSLDSKRAAKADSLEMIRGNEQMKAGLKRSAVADSE